MGEEGREFPGSLYIHRWPGIAKTLDVNFGASEPLSPFTDDVMCLVVHTAPQRGSPSGRIFKLSLIGR